MLEVRVDSADVERALARLADDLADLPVQLVADRAARAVAGFAPRRSGRLASSVSGWDAGGARVEVRVESVYGGVINYGWPARNIAPAGFVERGVESALPGAVSDVADAVQSAINQEGLS